MSLKDTLPNVVIFVIFLTRFRFRARVRARCLTPAVEDSLLSTSQKRKTEALAL